MNWIVYHIASGHAFFSGVALILVAAIASVRSTPNAERLKIVFCLIGAIAIAISSTAIPYWCYAIATVITIFWLYYATRENWRRWTRISVIIVWAIVAAMELPYHIPPTLVPASARSMTIIGDSITSGLGPTDNSVRWPTQVATAHRLSIQDISHPGESTASALRRAKSKQIVSAVVILEIGGNDLFGKSTSAEFARDLDGLLAYVSAPGRQVVMFELPLPPFYNEFGRIQRSLARKHGVSLVPKWVFLSVLAPKDSTVDTIHLTQAGHDRMAATVWNIVRSAFPSIAPAGS